MVEFYCCGQFYCYKCVMELYNAARRNGLKRVTCPNCR
jgi:hypothetical protein